MFVCLDLVYEFIRLHRTEVCLHNLSFFVRDELQLVQGLVLVPGTRDLSLPPRPVMFCGDSSEHGYLMLVSRASVPEVLELTRYFEKWRFRTVEPEFMDRVRRRQNPGLHIKVPESRCRKSSS